MTQSEAQSFRPILDAKRRSLEASLRDRGGIVIEMVPESMDGVALAGERDLAISRGDMHSRTLRQVSAALERIEDGSFGVCVECDEEISTRRLAAIPWAARCLVCEEALERRPVYRGTQDFDHPMAA